MIFFYQTNGAGLLPNALQCAWKFTRDIAVISDQRYPSDVPYVWVPLNRVWQDFLRVDDVYQHNSENDALFERECIRRWFAARRALELMKLPRAFFADSDCLVCCDPMKQPHVLPDTTLALCSETKDSMVTAGMSVQSVDSLRMFEDFILSEYFSNPLFSDGGKNDMDAWNHVARGWGERAGFPWVRLTGPKDGVVFDHHLMVTQGYVVDERYGCKYLEFPEGIPHARLLNGNRVRMAGLHCWGKTKPMMGSIQKLIRFA